MRKEDGVLRVRNFAAPFHRTTTEFYIRIFAPICTESVHKSVPSRYFGFPQISLLEFFASVCTELSLCGLPNFPSAPVLFQIFRSVSESISTTQDAFDGSTKVAEMSEPEKDNIVLESGAVSVGQASPLLGIAPEVEEAKEPVCTDPEGAKSCAAIAEGLRTAELNEAGIEGNGETIEDNKQPVEATEPMVGVHEKDRSG